MSSVYSGGAGIHLQTLVLDKSSTAEQKADCLKQLKVVLKNLADPIKSKDLKYRQLKTSNEKIQTKIFPCPSALDYLKAIGFTPTAASEKCEEEGMLRVEHAPDLVLMKASLQEVCNAIDFISTNSQPSTTISSSTTSSSTGSTGIDHNIDQPLIKKHRVQDETKEQGHTYVPVEKLSEKQKARRLLEEKEKLAREEAKTHRKRIAALIKADKFVRENDENWCSGQSAACVKSGNGISSFRDRFGE